MKEVKKITISAQLQVRKTLITFMNLQAKYLQNKGKQILLPQKKRKKPQCNHSALSNCSDIIMGSNEWNNSNSSTSERESVLQQMGELNTHWE